MILDQTNCIVMTANAKAAFKITPYQRNLFFEPKSLVVFHGDSLLKGTQNQLHIFPRLAPSA